MGARITALGILAIVLGIVVAFAMIALVGFPQDRQATRTSSGRQSEFTTAENLAFTGQLGPWPLDGQLALAPTGAFQLTLRVNDGSGQPVPASFTPTVRLDMLDHAMGGDLLAVASAGPGIYRVEGTLDMEGRWRFRIGGAGDEVDFTTEFRR